MSMLKDGTIVTADGTLEKNCSVPAGEEKIDCKGKLLLPGLIDCHVHFREPGLEHKATMATEAASAHAGGVTTVCEMPNTNPPNVTIAALADKVRRAHEVSDCDIRFFFGVTQREHLLSLVELWTGSAEELQRLKKHCCGVKVYLDHSTGDQKIEEELISDVFAACGKHKIPLVAHCEDPATNNAAAAELINETDISSHSRRRPPEAEVIAVKKALALAKKHKTPFHVAHLSTAGALDLVRAAKQKKLTVTCEVAPHHLFLTTEDYVHIGTFGKMNPPLRSIEDRDALWAGVIDGTVDCIATDHAPHTLNEKQDGTPLSAPSGVPGVETMLPLLLSVTGGHWPNPHSTAAAVQGFTPTHIVKLCFENPNRIFSLGKTPLSDKTAGDVLIIDPNAFWTLKGTDLHSKCGWTPFEGWRVKGKIERVIRA